MPSARPGDAEGIPPIVDVCEFAAAQHSAVHGRRTRSEAELVALREVAPAVPAGLVRFESVGDSPAAQVFTGLVVLYASLRAAEHVPPGAQRLYMRVAAVMFDGTLLEVAQAAAGADAPGSESARLSRVLAKYKRVMFVERSVEGALACAAEVHRLLARMPDGEGRELDAEACGAAMASVTGALHAIEIIASGHYGS
jgi:hypothetical protein